MESLLRGYGEELEGDDSPVFGLIACSKEENENEGGMRGHVCEVLLGKTKNGEEEEMKKKPWELRSRGSLP